MTYYEIKDPNEFKEDIKNMEEPYDKLSEITGLVIPTISSFLNEGSTKLSEKSIKGYFKLFEKKGKSVAEYTGRFSDSEGVKRLLIDNGKRCVIEDISKDTDKIITYLEQVLDVEACPCKYRVQYKGNNFMQIKRMIPQEFCRIDTQHLCDTLTVMAFKEIDVEINNLKNTRIEDGELILLIHEKGDREYTRYKEKLKKVTIIELIVNKKTEKVTEIRCIRRNSDVYLHDIFLDTYSEMLKKRTIPMTSREY